MKATLARRLERLEKQITPEEVEARVWQVVIVDSKGNQTEGPRIVWQPPSHTRT